MLILNDYDKYIGRLKKPLRHNLTKITLEAVSAYGLNPLRDSLIDEIRNLSDFYATHRLRYGTMGDIFIDPRTIPHKKVFQRLGATIRLADRVLIRSQTTAAVVATRNACSSAPSRPAARRVSQFLPLFGTGLLALAGFAVYRSRRTQRG